MISIVIIVLNIIRFMLLPSFLIYVCTCEEYCHFTSQVRSLDSSVGIVTRLQAGRHKNRGSSPGRVKRPALELNQTHIQIAPGANSPGIKRPRREADYSPLFSVEFKTEWICTLLPVYAVMA